MWPAWAEAAYPVETMPAPLPLALLPLLVAGDEPAPVDFSREVQPILSQHCFVCHGPDEGTREADLRLDLPSVVGEAEGIVVPGKPEASELVYRITSEYDDEVMPPPDGREGLSAEEIAILTRWVEEGAEYAQHWSFRPVLERTLPAFGRSDWVRNPIDAFVLARLEAEGLEPSPEADRATLIRRLSLDLCGVPPTPEEVAAFAADGSPGAYGKLVDRLLASDAYAERMTLAWMDAARYGDTSVHHADGPRDMWPWRDWVIDAYRAGMPFDQFTLEQLAGDLLPEPTREQLVASGFHRNTPTSDEGGAIDEELRVKYMVDRVKTTANVWLGLSMECAQCHDHKYDNITQRDYYRFYGYFNQSVEKGFQTRNGNAEPLIQVPSMAQRSEQAELASSLEAIEAHLTAVQPPQAELAAWCEEERAALLERADPELGPWFGLGPFRGADKGEAYRTDYGPEAGPIELDAVLGELRWTERPDEDGKVHNFEPPADNAAMYLTRTVHVDRAQSVLVSLGSDDSIAVWLNGQKVFARDVGRGAAPDQDEASLDLVAGENRLLLKIVNGGGPTGYYFKLKGVDLPGPVIGALKVEPAERGDAEREALRDHFVRRLWEPGKAEVARARELRGQLEELERAIPTVMVMKDLSEGRMTHVLDRGQYDAPREDEALEPGVLEHVFPLPEGAPPTRLGLARWLMDPDHPLTARVTVNRYWAMLFGRGLVPTVMDFGSQGDRPSHPELLDWLARDFVDSGWDVKRCLKQMVMSATYRQSSAAVPERVAADPENALLARAPRVRLHGEFLRDQALAVSGLLVDRVGGPGVKPYQPPGLWNEVSLDGNLRFRQDSGEKLYRKSMYIYWKRSAPMPAMAIFDTPIRDTCVVQRQRTNTPLQALVTLNDVQFVEAARHLAQRLLTSESTFEARLDLGFLLCTARPADELRRGVMRGVLDEQLGAFAADPEAAAELLAVGESPADPELDPLELASWTVLASMLFNLDETLNRE